MVRETRKAYLQLLASHFTVALGFSVFSLLPKYLLTTRGLTQAELGPATMAIPLGSLLFAPITAWALGRASKAQLVRWGALGFALVSAGFAAGPSTALVPLLAALVGGSVMVVFSSGSGLMAEVAPQAAMARALGLHGAAGMVGHAIGPLALERIAHVFGFEAAFACAGVAACLSALIPLPAGPPRASAALAPSAAIARAVGPLLVISSLAGVMHNALWVSHQPLVLARGGTDMGSYYLGMSAGGILMRVAFGGLPDRLGVRRSVRASLALYTLATLGMAWVTPTSLGAFGLLHGIAHGVFYPATGAMCTARLAMTERGRGLMLLYAAFNIGASLGSISFAHVGAAFGPASVFPVAATCGLLALGVLSHRGLRAAPASP
jgi:MFS family permease